MNTSTAGAEKVLYESDFGNGAKDWTATNQAEVSGFARRPGGASLLIRQSNNEEANSAWLGPVMENPGVPIRVSLWAADNYLFTADHSFSAAFEILPCEPDGTLFGSGGDWTYIPWNSERYMPQYRHTYTEDGLQWKHYETISRVNSSHFRLRLSWPKTRMQGECYFTDIRVSAAPDQASKDAVSEKPVVEGPSQILEISTAEVANLFYHDDPLRFEFLLYNPGGEPVAPLSDPVLHYTITDYEYFHVAKGSIPFSDASPLVMADPAMEKALSNRTPNLHYAATIEDPAAREVGRYFILNVRLLDGETLVAEDTVTYAVVDPRRLPEERLEDSRFISFYTGGGFRNTASQHEDQTLGGKMGESLSHDWDYHGWRKAQPERDAPISIEPGPDFPKLVYCPNLEQIRGRKPGHPWGDMSVTAPEWALLDDPFHPGCTTFDIDAYVDYIVAYVRANRHRIVQVVPSGLERSIDDRTLELQRKAYAALKKEFPDLPVGMMVWEVLSAEGVELILREKLYEVADFFDTHVYLSAVDWTEWNRLRTTLERKGIERRLISTEFARVGGSDQLQSARDMITSQLDAHANDMYRLTYFNMFVGNNDPIREAIPRGNFGGDGFQWMQYADRPRIAASIEGDNWRNGLYGRDNRGSSMMPMLQAIASYNFVQAVEGADFKAVFQPTPRSIAYVYDRDGETVCYLFLREPSDPVTLLLNTEVPYSMQDLYGRTDRVEAGGPSLVVATLDPLRLIFEGEVPALYDEATAQEVLSPVEGGLALPAIARGASGNAKLTLPPVFGRAFSARVEATVDGTWPDVAAATVEVSPDETTSVTLPISVPGDRAGGVYTFTTRLYDGDRLVSVLKQPLQVEEVLTLTLLGEPMTPTQDPAIRVEIVSLADSPMEGTVTLDNRLFGTGFEPDAMVVPYQVEANGRVSLTIPVPRDQVSLASSYVLRASLEDSSGFAIQVEDDISFQASVRTQQPIVVDGDLSDWDLEKLLPIPFERWFRGPRPEEEFSGKFYSRWDENRLYFAAVITDNVPVATGVEQIEWNDDNIMLGIYPWRWHKGQPLNTGYYREHLGPLRDGGASFMRAGNVPSGPSTAEGAEIAVMRTPTGWIYEWAYPRESLHPLVLEPGGGFRLSLTVWDQHQVPKKGWGEFTWLTFAGFNTSVNAQPNLWRQFTLVE